MPEWRGHVSPRPVEIELRPRTIGALRVQLVPLRYDADGSGRLPDTSPQQLNALREALLAMYPVPAVELTVREPVATSVALAPKSGWASVLEDVRRARAQDRAPDDVYYFGLVAPADNHAKYCGGGCTTGASFTASAGSVRNRASVGLGFTGAIAVDAMVHELGHAHGRAHAPCGRPDRTDPAFPYPEALIGTWGYDVRGTGEMRSPERTRDIMSYCGPRWVSDYTYRGLTARSAEVNRVDSAVVAVVSRLISDQPAVAGIAWRTLVVGAGGEVTWGEGEGSPPSGTAATAQLFGAGGEPLGTIEVQAIEIADTDERMFWIPRDTGGAHTLVVPGISAITLPSTP